MRTLTGVCLTAILWALGPCEPSQAAPYVTFELVTGGGFPIAATQKWVNLFKGIESTRVRIRGAQGNERPTVENIGTETSPSYHVVGILIGDNRLRLMTGDFRPNDKTKIVAWIKKLRAEGIDGLTAVRVAFGLTSEQLVAFHQRVSKPIQFTTKDVRAGDVVRQIVRGLQVQFVVSPVARAAFARDEACTDELNGIAGGTALAATLRPLGLIWRPRKREDGMVILWIKEVSDADESWPVGWPIKDNPYSTAPKLFESLQVVIQDTPLSEAITAIQPRVELPFLFDHNSMARHRVDPATAKVDFPSKRASYKRILDTILFQSGLATELRMDEAEKPFLWISTTKR